MSDRGCAVTRSDLVDANGTLHERAGDDARIVCLVPSITELICDLRLADRLVGRTGFCIHPRALVASVPKVGGTKDVKLHEIRALVPTHAVVNIDENRLETAAALAEFVPHVVVTHPQAPDDNPPLYRLLGAIFGRESEAELLCSAFEKTYADVQALAPRAERRVLYLVWRKPWMTVAPDTYISRTLALFGWQTQPEVALTRYPEISLAAFDAEVDRVLLSSEPYRFRERHIPEVQAAFPRAIVSLIDGEMTSWYGSRAIEGLRYLTEYTRP